MPQRLQYHHFEIETDDKGHPVKLGAGGMGTTYKAYDTRLMCPAVVKVINDALLDRPEIRKRFFNEARAAARLKQENIARVLYCSPEDADVCFFAMEFIEGETLYSRITKGGPMESGEALNLLRGMVLALQAMGDEALIHRDIKPHNIMVEKLRRGSRAKLIDFGLAKVLDDESDLHYGTLTETGHFLGSLYFASPEQIEREHGVRLDCRTDFYSLGATLWHVLTGLPPFTGSMSKVIQGHVTQQPPWEKLSGKDDATTALIRCLLEKDREMRPANADVLLERWDATLATVLAKPAAASTVPIPAARTGASTFSNPRIEIRLPTVLKTGSNAPAEESMLRQTALIPPAMPQEEPMELGDSTVPSVSEAVLPSVPLREVAPPPLPPVAVTSIKHLERGVPVESMRRPFLLKGMRASIISMVSAFVFVLAIPLVLRIISLGNEPWAYTESGYWMFAAIYSAVHLSFQMMLFALPIRVKKQQEPRWWARCLTALSAGVWMGCALAANLSSFCIFLRSPGYNGDFFLWSLVAGMVIFPVWTGLAGRKKPEGAVKLLEWMFLIGATVTLLAGIAAQIILSVGFQSYREDAVGAILVGLVLLIVWAGLRVFNAVPTRLEATAENIT